VTDVTITAADGERLVATLHEPARGPARAWLVINSAMGVRRRFYRHLAGHLAAEGIGTLTYDYRGMGDSRLAPGAAVRLEDWGRRDFPAVTAWLRAHRAPTRLAVLGHSVGGQLLGLAPEVGTFDAVVGVATQSGWWGHWDGVGRAKVFALWHVAIPLATAVSATFPAALFGLGQDLPAGVARQWAAWGRDPDYARSPRVGPQPQYHAEVRCALRTYLVRGDDLAPERAVRAWHDWFPNARRELVDLGTRNAAGARIGHFGFFDPAIGGGEWPALAAFLGG
jgi:predicted alpha/beta hydrolase